MTDAVTLVDVGPRDGLQNEPGTVSTALKIELLGRLVTAGVPVVEATSFVSPKWVPQMADAADVMAGLPEADGVRFPVLVPNLKGYERAVAAGAREVAVFTAASETFSRKNTNAGIHESLERLAPVIDAAQRDGLRVRGYVSCVLGCPFEGEIRQDAVVNVAVQLRTMGCGEISLGDTIGVGTPRRARSLIEAVSREMSARRIAVHFHDTYGQALANILACLEAGIRTVDASVGGLGGCPYAPGATGNVASEDVVYLLHGIGMPTGIDLDALAATGQWISEQLGRANASRAGRALAARGH